MRRRSLLAVVGSLAVGSGCVEKAPTVTETPSATVEVTKATVQPAFVTAHDDSIRVVDDAGQYLVLELDGDAPDRSAVGFWLDGTDYTPESFAGRLYRGDFDGETYGENGGPLVFALPETGDGGDAELVWGMGKWSPSATVVERLEEPLPPFSVSLDGPDTAGDESDLEITVTVTNEGEGAGRYVLALNRQGPRIASAPVGRLSGELEPGATETRTVDAVPPDDRTGTGYLLQVPGERDSRDHYIEPTEPDDA